MEQLNNNDLFIKYLWEAIKAKANFRKPRSTKNYAFHYEGHC